jgi:hypothetical protein
VTRPTAAVSSNAEPWLKQDASGSFKLILKDLISDFPLG